jgi:hypothetical protein
MCCALAALVGCGGSGGSGIGADASGTDDSSVTDGAGQDGFIGFPEAGGSCSSAADCDGGVCAPDGTCCGSATQLCGAGCCASGTVCLFNACVTPGKPCTASADCGAGEYCETALGGASGADGGTGDAGTFGEGGVACTHAPPSTGRCLPLPATCASDGGVDAAGSDSAADAGCLAACEYHPPVGGTLSATAAWKWGPTAKTLPNYTDVWATPVVGRVYDTNCDGKIDELDTPVVVFVSGNDFAGAPNGSNCQTATAMSGVTMCHTGALRMLDGSTGEEIWTVAHATGSEGFAGTSVAIGDVDGDGAMDIVAITGEGYVVLMDAHGTVQRTSDKPIPAESGATFGWGGGISLADMDNDGFPEIVYGNFVYTTTGGAITQRFVGAAGQGGQASYEALSTVVDLDGAADHHLELLAGNTAYKADGTILWHRADLPDGFPAVGDFNLDGKPDVVLVGPTGTPHQATVWLLDGATGATLLGPTTLPTTVHPSDGGPPTVAAFDGTGKPQIGVATADYYWVIAPNFTTKGIDVVWKMPNHDFSSSVTGSTVFDFEGAGHPSVIYADECFLWVFDGATGKVRFAAPHTSFTGTEASLVADVDGDGHAEILMVTNGADPSSAGWGCMDASGTPVTVNGVKWTPSALPNESYRGIVSFADTAHSWVGTRTLWNQHAYHVSNICDDRDSACDAPNVYGSIPKVERTNWTVPWLNNFRQNVQDKGLFNAPDAVISLSVDCATPPHATADVRNIGLAVLPVGVPFEIYEVGTSGDTKLGAGATTIALFPGQTQAVDVPITPVAGGSGRYYAKIIVDPTKPAFHECRSDNDQSDTVTPSCVR